MKLYTEADLKKVISIYSEEYKTSTDEILKELNLTPIELPSDEEIYSQAQQHSLQCALENFFDEDEITIIKHHWVQGYKKAVNDFLTYGGNK